MLPSGCLQTHATSADYQFATKYFYLLEEKPTDKNYQNYARLARTLWNLNRIDEAEKMFLTIYGSREEYYTSTYQHNSDIPGDTSSNIYGYGSFTSHYKNDAAKHLSKIYIVKKEFTKALSFLDSATKRYPVVFTCGTGAGIKRNENLFLYASCHNGLQNYEKTIELLLPDCLGRHDDLIITAITNSFTVEEIKSKLLLAEQSLTYVADTMAYYTVTRSSDNGTSTTSEMKYAGFAEVLLFGWQVQIPSVLVQSEPHIDKATYMKAFKESHFYRHLARLCKM
jgi:tetratricopeptide (TPR) repeat protein